MEIVWNDGEQLQTIAEQQILDWWNANPVEEAFEATVLAYMQANTILPADQIGFILYEYSPPNIRYETIICEVPLAQDWWMRRQEGLDVFD